jgi:Ni,Fe-hydrogenase III small subunit
MSGIAGLRGTGDWGVDERPKSFREGILRFNPNGTAPIFALSSKAKKRSVTDPEFAWWAEGNVLIRLQVSAAFSATDTLISVDTVDPTSTTLSANLGTATNLKPGDILLVEPTVDTATLNQELLEVDNVLSDTQFTARRGAGGTTAATIANDQFLTVVSSAYAEGTGVPRSVSRNPIKFFNFIQIFKDTYELTGTADKTVTRTNNNYSEDKKRKMFKHSSDIEWSILLGRPAETTGDNGKPKRFMGGIRNFIPPTNVTIFGAPVTPSSFLDALAPVFDFDTGAGDTRMMFAGNQALIELSKVFANEVIFNVNNVVKVYGMDFQEFILPNGRVLIKSHPLLSRHGLYKKSGFVIDFDALSYVTMTGRPDGRAKDDVQTDDEDVRRGFWQTDCSLELDYGGLTMAYLGNISAT